MCFEYIITTEKHTANPKFMHWIIVITIRGEPHQNSRSCRLIPVSQSDVSIILSFLHYAYIHTYIQFTKNLEGQNGARERKRRFQSSILSIFRRKRNKQQQKAKVRPSNQPEKKDSSYITVLNIRSIFHRSNNETKMKNIGIPKNTPFNTVAIICALWMV